MAGEAHVRSAQLVLISDVDVLDGDLEVVHDVADHPRYQRLVLLLLIYPSKPGPKMSALRETDLRKIHGNTPSPSPGN